MLITGAAKRGRVQASLISAPDLSMRAKCARATTRRALAVMPCLIAVWRRMFALCVTAMGRHVVDVMALPSVA